MKFKVTTESRCIYEYLVEATDEENAEEIYGDYIAHLTDCQNESVINVEEI